MDHRGSCRVPRSSALVPWSDPLELLLCMDDRQEEDKGSLAGAKSPEQGLCASAAHSHRLTTAGLRGVTCAALSL